MEETLKTERGHAKLRQGIVTSNKMNKTLIIKVASMKKHPTYGKYVNRTKRYVAHDERNECQIGDLVEIVETRPLSKTKRWRLKRIVRKAE
jgi:small subunit ribosomal protein S17